MAILTTVLLLLPMLVCNSLESPITRLSIVAVSVVIFIATISGITKAKSFEVFVASATYVTISGLLRARLLMILTFIDMRLLSLSLLQMGPQIMNYHGKKYLSRDLIRG